MTMRIDIVQQAPTIKIDPTGKIVMVDFKVLKGDKGDPGEPGVSGIVEHLSMFDHGDLHEHANKSLLDDLSWDADEGLLVNGISVFELTPMVTVMQQMLTNVLRKVYLNGVEVDDFIGPQASISIPLTGAHGSDDSIARLEGAVSASISGAFPDKSVTVYTVFGLAVVINTAYSNPGG